MAQLSHAERPAATQPEAQWPFETIPADRLRRLVANCTERGFAVECLPDRAAACRRVEELLPDGADVSTGGSVTLAEIGFLNKLDSGDHPWRYRRTEISAEGDADKRQSLRRRATAVDTIIGSVNALAISGEAVCADFGGTRVAAYAYGARRVIWVVGTNKIVDSLAQAIDRLRHHVLPLEDERTRAAWGIASKIGKLLVVEHEVLPERIRLLIVDEHLGF